MNLLLATFPLAVGAVSDGALAATFDSTSKAILYWVGNAVLYGSALALLTWALLSTALRRTRPTIHAAFWLLVIAKFLLPLGPGWSYSFSSLISGATGWLRPAQPPAVEASVPAAAPTSNFTLFLFWSPNSENPSAAPSAAPAAPVKTSPSLTLSSALVATYLLGLIVIATIRLAAYRRVLRSVRKLPAADQPTRALVHDVGARLRFRGTLDVRISEAAPAPYIVGAWRPMLVLSTRNLASREECEAVVLHELAHLRRHDLLVRYAQWLAGTVLYFWPVVAWVNRRIDLAREAACDEWALRHGRLSPAEYARCLLKCAQPVRSGLNAYAPAAMAANASHVERRIEMILDTQTTTRRSRMLALLGGAALCGWTGFALSGASAALPSKPAEDANKTPSAQWWQAHRNGPLSFFLPQVADSLADEDADADEDRMVFIAADGAEAESVHGMALMHFMRSAPQISAPHVVAGRWIGGDRMIDLNGAQAVAGQPQVFVCTSDGQQPGLDLDSDGAVSADEHEAYLLALAMRDSAGMLAKYPKADENSDGALSVEEASAFLSGGFLGGAEPAMFDLAVPGGPDAAGGMFEIKLDAAAGDVHRNIALALQPLVEAHVGAATAGDFHQRVWKVLTDVSSGEPTQNVEFTAEVKCEGDAQIQIMPTFKMVRGANINLAIEAVAENSTTDSAGSAAPTMLRLIQKIETSTGDDGQPVTTITEQTGDAEPKVVIMHGAMEAQPSDVQVAGVPLLSKVPLLSHLFSGTTTDLSEPPALWLLQNAGAAPTVDDVRKCATIAGDAALKRFLKMHPKSDANKDGALTAQERDAYLEKMQSHSRQRLLKRFPQADANGDGLLTNEEKREFFKNRKSGSADGAPQEVEVEATGDGAQGLWIRSVHGSADGAVEVKGVRAGEATEGPR